MQNLQVLSKATNGAVQPLDAIRHFKPNFQEYLEGNVYPGRFFVIGLTRNGEPCIIYGVTGRSTNSQSRYIQPDFRNGCFRGEVKPLYGAKLEQPELLTYDAIRQYRYFLRSEEQIEYRHWAVSNGRQTLSLVDGIVDIRNDFSNRLSQWSYEPDAPNFTSRISGAICLTGVSPAFMISCIRPWRKGDPETYRVSGRWNDVWRLDQPSDGTGWFTSTYDGTAVEGEPLSRFSEDPIQFPIEKLDAEGIAEDYWTAMNYLDQNYRVALMVTVINSDGSLKECATRNLHESRTLTK